MNQVATIETHPPTARAELFEEQLTPSGKLGMWIFLAGDAMTFGVAMAAYGALRWHNVNWPDPADWLGIRLTAIMTFVLICSSVTMVESLSGAEHGNLAKMKEFLLFTILGGVIFLGLQAFEWSHLIMGEGLSIKTSLFAATFFILTGFHGCHVFGGVVYNSVLLVRGAMGRITQANARLLEIAGLYWHFVDLVWILIFTFVYLI